jgi:predicted dehydrogenase
MTLRRGAEVAIQQTAASWTPGVIGVSAVAGTDGTIEVNGDGVWCSDRSGRRLLDVPADLALPAAPGASDDPRHRYTHLEVGPYTRLCEALRAGVEGRAVTSAVPVPTFADGLACMQVLDAIRASAATGGAVVNVGE